jgi:hypothetical protein
VVKIGFGISRALHKGEYIQDCTLQRPAEHFGSQKFAMTVARKQNPRHWFSTMILQLTVKEKEDAP